MKRYNTKRYMITEYEDIVRFESIDACGPDGEFHESFSELSFPQMFYSFEQLENILKNIEDLKKEFK